MEARRLESVPDLTPVVDVVEYEARLASGATDLTWVGDNAKGMK
jgi:hypothetical protein